MAHGPKLIDRIDAFQRRHPASAFPLAVVYKFAEDRGPHLAALMAYYGFVSVFPLLLLLVSVLGFVLQPFAGADPDLSNRAVTTTIDVLAGVPVLGSALQGSITGLRGSGVALTIGALGTLYGGMGVMQATQAALNRIYAVPRYKQPNPILSRLRSIVLMVALGLLAIVATAISVALPQVAQAVPVGGGLLLAAGTLVPFAINTGIFIVIFRVLTAVHLGWRNVLIGALVAAGLWEVLQTVFARLGGAYLQHAGDVYGVFGVVLGLVAWLYLQSMALVLAAEINVVRQRRLYPRALLTPFTDDVDLTPQDVRTYTGYARSETYKGFETVTATFDKDAPPEEPTVRAAPEAASETAPEIDEDDVERAGAGSGAAR
ncbi:YihY family inner membrane protein [Quadrisphaera granulorum]|uniref:YihY family inner membrane protein n=1 Tax=Quadrisphaera granulorum TaxID=317664 RepID=A0A316AWN4_9ACTN|nr:YihY/virulence factor BrkB family protein [Quadrisphaera granulorum]PWJ54577.1 YihY family inner membrane protein [Quadrisphaera granulorum]SZE95939.1 YihY family inner membrane protein [Quadrisphaera granulorum]